jgi:uncharacterized protein (TIGR03435 family)
MQTLLILSVVRASLIVGAVGTLLFMMRLMPATARHAIRAGGITGMLLSHQAWAAACVFLSALVVAGTPVQAQSPPAEQSAAPKFEVASIRPSKDCTGGPTTAAGRPSPGRFDERCVSLVSLINSAYVWFANGRQNSSRYAPILGGQSWINSDLYDINAKAEGGPPQEIMRGPMLQELLEERFKLKIHKETREVPVYLLTVAKGGLKLRPFKEGSCIPLDLNTLGPRAQGQKAFCSLGGIRPKGNDRARLMIDAQAMDLDAFAKFLGLNLDRPIIDKTGIAGIFDFHLEFAPDETTPRLLRGSGAVDAPGLTPTEPSSGSSIREAIQEQLGLRLDPAKGPGEILVIDHVEKPSDN